MGESLQQRSGEREQARVLQSQIERMSQQIDYQLQRASLRKSGLVRHSVLLRPLLESLCSTLAKVYRDKRVDVTLQLPDAAQVPMEQGALLELLGNLLENAYRLSLRQVRVSLEQAPGQLTLCIEDDGPGVDGGAAQPAVRAGWCCIGPFRGLAAPRTALPAGPAQYLWERASPRKGPHEPQWADSANAPVQIPPPGGNPPAFLRQFAPSLGVYPSQIRHLHPSWAFWHHPCY